MQHPDRQALATCLAVLLLLAAPAAPFRQCRAADAGGQGEAPSAEAPPPEASSVEKAETDNQADKKVQAAMDRVLSQEANPWGPMGSGHEFAFKIGARTEGSDRRLEYFHLDQMIDNSQRVLDGGGGAEQQADVQVLLDACPQALPAIHQRLARVDPDAGGIGSIVLVIGRRGTRQSLPVLIDLLDRVEKVKDEKDFSAAHRRLGSILSIHWALWELTGRPVIRSAPEWQKWWQAVGGESFTVARERDKAAVRQEQVRNLVGRLTAAEEFADERLIVLGPNAVAHLLEHLDAADDELRHRLARVIDESGGAAQLPRELRLEYSTRRLATVEDFNTALEKRAHLRALRQQDFADFCRMAIEVDRRREAEGKSCEMWGWVKMSSDVFREHLAADFRPLVPPAVPVLAEGLASPSKAARRVAVELSGVIGFSTAFTSRELILALEKSWLAETDDWMRSETTVAIARYVMPEVDRVIRDGLAGERVEILAEAASMVGWALRDLSSRKDPKVLARIAELTGHENDYVRYRATRTLYEVAPNVLVPHVARLAKDRSAEVRRYCAGAMGEIKDSAHADLLVRLAYDEDRQVRSYAIRALGNPAFRSAVPKLVPLLDEQPEDEPNSTQRRWDVLQAIVATGGPEAVAALVDLLRRPNPFENQVMMNLEVLTGRKFARPEQWIKWHRSQPAPGAT